MKILPVLGILAVTLVPFWVCHNKPMITTDYQGDKPIFDLEKIGEKLLKGNAND